MSMAFSIEWRHQSGGPVSSFFIQPHTSPEWGRKDLSIRGLLLKDWKRTYEWPANSADLESDALIAVWRATQIGIVNHIEMTIQQRLWVW